MRVKDLMTSSPTYSTPYWTADAVAALMDHAGTGCIPVVEDLLHRKVIGIVTDRGLCVRVIAAGEYPARKWVRDCMTQDPTCCHPEDRIEEALQLMAEKRVQRLPVIDEQRQLKGMISISDLVRCEALDLEPIYRAIRKICERSTGLRKTVDNIVDAA